VAAAGLIPGPERVGGYSQGWAMPQRQKLWNKAVKLLKTRACVRIRTKQSQFRAQLM
jgi:hypothetical protein